MTRHSRGGTARLRIGTNCRVPLDLTDTDSDDCNEDDTSKMAKRVIRDYKQYKEIPQTTPQIILNLPMTNF